jgi:nitrate reductase NapE component
VGKRTCSGRLVPHRLQNTERQRERVIFGVLRRLWIPLVILAVVVAGGFAVFRIHGIFGSEKRPSYSDTKSEQNKPFNPKHLTYEIFGPPGTTADISYFDLNAEPQRVDGAHLPWSLELTTTLPSVMGDLVAQGDSNTLGCRILVDGQVKDERISHEVNAYVFCLVKGV